MKFFKMHHGRKIGVGGYYRINKMHKEEELDCIDEATLLEVGLILVPVREKLKDMEDENNND